MLVPLFKISWQNNGIVNDLATVLETKIMCHFIQKCIYLYSLPICEFVGQALCMTVDSADITIYGMMNFLRDQKDLQNHMLFARSTS